MKTAGHDNPGRKSRGYFRLGRGAGKRIICWRSVSCCTILSISVIFLCAVSASFIGRGRMGKTMEKYVLEVCVDSVESALAAKAGGATRLELCANLVIGGTTPGYTLFEQIKRETGLPVRTLIRPRFGDFLYTEYEYQQMLQDIRHFAQAGADGVVIGSLNADGTLQEEQMRGMIEAAGKCEITLHRAFDVCVDPIAALQKAEELGVNTILTSGQEADCLAGSVLLAELVKHSGSLTIMAGAGVTSSNLAELAAKTGAHAFHMSGKKMLPSGVCYRNARVPMGLEG